MSGAANDTRQTAGCDSHEEQPARAGTRCRPDLRSAKVARPLQDKGRRAFQVRPAPARGPTDPPPERVAPMINRSCAAARVKARTVEADRGDVGSAGTGSVGVGSDAGPHFVCAAHVPDPVSVRLNHRQRTSRRDPSRGGPLLADHCVACRSLCSGMTPSSILVFGQNWLRAGGSILLKQGLDHPQKNQAPM
jgi:hypothetical protein